MKEVYIGFPSLTEAQRAAEELRQSRIGCAVSRMPVLPGKSGCAYGLRLREEVREPSLARLRERGFRTGRVVVRNADGSPGERNG